PSPTTGCMVVGLGAVFLHNDLAVFAYDLLSPGKRLLWKYEENKYGPEEVMDDERVDHTCTLSNGRLFANIVTHVGEHEMRLSWLTVKYPIPRRALFAFDARTRKILWQLGGQPGTPDFPGAASIPHAPAAVGDWLYAGATHALYTTDPPDHYVFCIDPATGKLRWSTFIASAVLDINLFNNPTRETVGSPASVCGDIVYYCSNIGVVAALDVTSGRIVWLSRYRHIPTQMPRNAYMPPRRPQGWWNNPPIVADGKLIVTPTDSPFLYVFDALTGKELARRAREEMRGDCAACDFKHVLGADSRTVVVSCPHVVAALSLEDGNLLAPKWRCLLSPESCHGRGALAGGSVLVPCNTVLMRIDLASGKLLNRWAWQPLGGEQLGSNVVLTDTALVAASSQGLRAFYSPEKVEQALAAELAADPDKPDVLYRVGQSYLRTAKRQEGVALIEKAAGLAARSSDREMAALTVQCRRSLFDHYLESAEAGGFGITPQARSDYETAKRWAPDGECYVRATMKYAARLLKAGALDDCVAQHSEIIAAYPEVEYESLRAGDFAQGEIAKVIAAHGRAPYAAIEKNAAAALEAARKSGLHKKFMRVFASFPNSQAAEQALLEAARNATAEKSWDSVTEALRVLLRQFPGSKSELEAHLMLLQAYEAKRMPAAARNVLRTLLQSFADREVDAEGAKQTVREFVERRLNTEFYVGKQPPPGARQDISPPLSLVWRHAATQGEKLTVLVPGTIDRRHPSTEWFGLDRLFLAMTDYVLCLSTSTGALQWELPVPGGVTDTTPWLHQQYLIFSSGATLVAVDFMSGMIAWSTTFESHVVDMALCDGMVHAATFDARSPDDLWVHTVDANTGAVRWRQSIVQFHSEGMSIVGDYLVLHSVQRPVLIACPRLSGDAPRRIQLNGRVHSIAPATHDTVVVVTTDLYARAIAIPDGAERWNTRLGPVFAGGDLFASTSGLFVYFQQGTPRNRLVLVDLDSGKMRLRRDVGADGIQRGWWVLNDHVYTVFTDRSRGSATVQALELLEGEVRMQFTPPQVDRRSEFRPLASGKFLVFDGSSADQQDSTLPTRWTPRVFIVDAGTGALVQTLGSGDLPASASLPAVFLCGEHLLILQGETLSAFRAK
ncbi:MAG: PQQ-binding-like beta-propeller repeat protein, partial [Planctomycetota bacterium]|nr:PQQ-binding-like beta-propeller repeat protein [Planctomycetota bacterium]